MLTIFNGNVAAGKALFLLKKKGWDTLANSEFDTITAISTPQGEGGISIIRVSGEEAIPVVKKFWRQRLGYQLIPLIMVILLIPIQVMK